ncbi:MAG: nucleotidyl transferase AbiEii/AbiGii toxin family protein [Verrucomicrobia bacterium]|nr:nucleotidyl transferase AbiEii/AbiGii toxin family protein [Verrucomicrobiota bacterium]
MVTFLAPRLDILPAPQRALWPELRQLPPSFVLYGGTAIALRLGHRASLDFDFFSSQPFEVAHLMQTVSWLAAGEVLQSQRNTFTVIVGRSGPVKVSFFGGLSIGRVGLPQTTSDHVIGVASLLDLAATKLAVIQQRAEKRDYLDLAALMKAGVRLADALGAARALYGERFNPMISLKALSYFRDGDLPSLPETTQQDLALAAAEVTEIPPTVRASDSIAIEV